MRHPLVVAFVLASVGCVDGEADIDCDAGKCDDLIGRDVVIVPGEQVLVDRIPFLFLVEPTVAETSRTVTITTDEFRGDIEQLVGVARALEVVQTEQLNDDAGSFYGFRLEVRPDAQGEWSTVLPIPVLSTWSWNQVFLTSDGAGNLTVGGTAVEYRDVLAGIAPELEFRSIPEVIVPVRSTEFRVLVIPVWNFFDWDDDGYRTHVSFKPVR